MTKPTKWHVRPAKTQISLGIHPGWSEFWMPRLIWVFAVHMKKAWVLSYPLSAQRLGGCPGWSESLLAAQSFCWFCHATAHFVSVHNCMYLQTLTVCNANFCVQSKRLVYFTGCRGVPGCSRTYCKFTFIRENFVFVNIHDFDSSRIQHSHEIFAYIVMA